MGEHRTVAEILGGLVVLLVGVTMTICRENPSGSTTPTDAATRGLSEPEAGPSEDIDWLCGPSGDLDDSVPQPQHWHLFNFYPEGACNAEGRSTGTVHHFRLWSE